jgi:DnaK suppressor protein
MKKQVSETRIFREKLLEQKAQVERSVLSTVEQGRKLDAEDLIDPADQAVLSYQRELMFSRGTSQRTHLALIRLALQRLNDGTYGECLMCGEAISPKRLEAVPWTPYCISCQEKIENGELEEAERAA